jgi:hypothetical protein
MTEQELKALKEQCQIKAEDSTDERLRKAINYYMAIMDKGGKAINYKRKDTAANDIATEFVYHIRNCGINVIEDPMFADSKEDRCFILFYPKAKHGL